MINSFFAKWIQSHRDLPLLINQWANVVRWELRPRLFLRTSEFLWQEGHTAHATEDDARAYALRILRDVYRSTMVDVLAIPVLTGHKTARERFAGAIRTWTCEGMMGDGKALQMGTSHELGQNFATPFDITFSNASGSARVRLADLVGRLHPARRRRWSWATATTSGCACRPALAPAQVVVLVVKDDARGAARRPRRWSPSSARAGHRVRLDDRTDTSFGRRSVDWELKGVPVRVEVGPRDLAEGNVTVVTRHRREKANVAAGRASAGTVSRRAGRRSGAELLAEATAARDARTVDVATLEEAIEAGVGRLRPGPPGRARARRRGPPGRAGAHRPLPPAARRVAGRARATPRTIWWPSSAGRTSRGIAIIPELSILRSVPR